MQDKTGFEFQLGETINTKSGASIFSKQAESDITAAPKIVIKRKIGKKVDLSYGVGVSESARQEVNAEVELNPWMSIRGVFNSTEKISTQDNQSYGMDLKFQKRFK